MENLWDLCIYIYNERYKKKYERNIIKSQVIPYIKQLFEAIVCSSLIILFTFFIEFVFFVLFCYIFFLSISFVPHLCACALTSTRTPIQFIFIDIHSICCCIKHSTIECYRMDKTNKLSASAYVNKNEKFLFLLLCFMQLAGWYLYL